MKSRSLLIILITAVVVVVGALLLIKPAAKNMSMPAAQPPAASPPAASNTSTTPITSTSVAIEGYAFKPATLTVKKGTTVTWTNQDAVKHNAVVDEGQPSGGPDGPLIGQGQTYSFTFNTVGTFKYHCAPHPYMKGTVEVTE